MDAVMTEGKPKKKDGRKNYRSKEELTAIRAAFIKWIQHILDQKNWDATRLANESELAPSTLLRIINPKTFETHPFNISFMTMRKVAEGSGYPIPRTLIEANGVPDHLMPVEEGSVKGRSSARSSGRAPETKSVAQHDCPTIPMRHFTSLPRSLAPQVTDGQEACPPQMAGDDTAFAFMMPNDDLLPVVRSGMTMYATKRRDPAAGDIVLLVDKEGRSRVRIVEAVDEDGFHLERLNPDRKNEVLAFSEIEDFGVVEGVWRR